MSTTHGGLSSQAVTRLQGGTLILKDFDNDEIVDILDVSVSSVKNWRCRLKKKDGELHALARQKGSGRPPRLNDEQKQRLREIVLAGAVASGYSNERWTSRMIAEVIRRTFHVEYSASATRRLLRKLGLSPQLPVVKADKHSDEAVLKWANETWKRLKKKQRNSVCP